MAEAKKSAKTDAMRAAREEAWARQQAAEKARPKVKEHPTAQAVDDLLDRATHAPPARAPRPAPNTPVGGAKDRSAPRASTANASSSSDAAEGTCDGCGKLRAMRGGKISHHQKGLGKMCPGAGKAPR